MDYVERNYRIVEERMIEQMEESFEIGKELIDTELDAGLLNFIVKPIVKTFYKLWSDHDARIGTLDQIKIILDCARLLCDNENKKKYDEIIEEHFPKYLEGDQTYRQCKKNHKNYYKLKEITKECFISQVQELLVFLSTEDDAKTYDDLVKAVFKTKEKAYTSLKRQLDYNDDGIKIVEEDPSILKIPTGKNIILKVLRKGFEKTKTDLIQKLDIIFD